MKSVFFFRFFPSLSFFLCFLKTRLLKKDVLQCNGEKERKRAEKSETGK